MAKQNTGELRIIKSSVFDSINYAVFIKGSAKIMIINASNTIDFIIHYAQVNELLNTPNITFADAVKKDELVLPETLYTPRPVKNTATNRIFKKKEEYWSNSEIKCFKQANILINLVELILYLLNI